MEIVRYDDNQGIEQSNGLEKKKIVVFLVKYASFLYLLKVMFTVISNFQE